MLPGEIKNRRLFKALRARGWKYARDTKHTIWEAPNGNLLVLSMNKRAFSRVFLQDKLKEAGYDLTTLLTVPPPLSEDKKKRLKKEEKKREREGKTMEGIIKRVTMAEAVSLICKHLLNSTIKSTTSRLAQGMNRRGVTAVEDSIMYRIAHWMESHPKTFLATFSSISDLAKRIADDEKLNYASVWSSLYRVHWDLPPRLTQMVEDMRRKKGEENKTKKEKPKPRKAKISAPVDISSSSSGTKDLFKVLQVIRLADVMAVCPTKSDGEKLKGLLKDLFTKELQEVERRLK